MNDRLGYLRDKSNKLPLQPGVYLMKDKTDKIIYVGKAKNLKNRVTTYFHSIERHNIKTYKLVDNIFDFDFIVAPSELDALVLEASLIKQHNPKYNIMLKDDKGYNYIKVTKGDYPKITYALQTDDKNATYIGPYTSGFTVKNAVEEANRIFMLPSCTKKFPQDFRKTRPCLNYHIGRCMGVCQGRISSADYSGYVNSAIEYIQKGSKQSIERLTSEMNVYAEKLEFEKAAKLRDTILSIKKSEQQQKIYSSKTTDYDVIALQQDMELSSIAVVKYRGGHLVDKENFFIGDEYEQSQMRSDFVLGYYAEKEEIPREIYIDYEIDDKELLEKYFSEKIGHRFTITVPKRGEGLSQVMLARSNAGEYLALKIGKTVKELGVLQNLAKLLGLKRIPYYIESYDISNLGEETRVAGMIVYRNGRPYKAAYRKFTIKNVIGVDDYGSMQEVIRRRFQRYKDGDESFSTKPDLILLDGGRGHVSAVKEVLDEMQLDINLFGLVKDDKHRTRAIATEGGEIQINENQNVFMFLTNIQDEVHRYSINFQRQQHKKKQYELELTRVNGIGEAKAMLLLKEFKTKKAMKEASVEDLMKTAKISRETADELYLFIQEIF